MRSKHSLGRTESRSHEGSDSRQSPCPPISHPQGQCLAMSRDCNKSWLADIVLAFRAVEENDGRAWLQDIYEWIRRNRKQRPKNFDAVIRSTIELHSSDSKTYVHGYPDVFRHVARGIWALRFPHRKEVPQKSTYLPGFVLAQMTREELESFAGRGEEFRIEIDKRVEDVRRRFHMT